MNKTKVLIATAIMATLFSSCEKELEFDYREIVPVPVIEATLDESGATVSLTMTTPMDEPMDSTMITDATVVLTDLTESVTKSLTPDSSGLFRMSSPGIPGHEYQLTVETAGKRFESTTVMTSPSEIKGMAMEWIQMPYDKVALLKVDFGDDPSILGQAYWLRIYRNGKPYNWNIYNDHMASNGVISAIIMTTRKDPPDEDRDDLLVDGDTITATVASLTPAMNEYLLALTASGTNGPNMFSGDFCLGYFMAAPISSAAMIFRPDSIP